MGKLTDNEKNKRAEISATSEVAGGIDQAEKLLFLDLINESRTEKITILQYFDLVKEKIRELEK